MLNLIDIDCLSSNSCKNVSISAPDANAIDILCFEKNSCFGMEINGIFSKTINLVCDTNSNHSYSIWWWDYYSTDNQACSFIDIIGTNISNEFNLECDGFYACENLTIDVTEAKVININAIGTRSIYQSEIHGENSKIVNIISFAEDYIYCANDYSCAPKLYLPSYKDIDSPPTMITCQGYGCYNLNLYSLNGLLDYKFKLNSCGYCSDNYLCYADWNIFCGNNNYGNQLTVWSGSWCYDNICGCTESEQNALSNSWDTYNSLTCEGYNDYNYTCKYDDDYPGYCIIDCAEEYYTMDGCRDKVINAGDEGSSIIVNCGNSGTANANKTGGELGLCENTKIYCPNKEHTECVINCIDDDSCAHAKIYAEPGVNNANTLWLNCSDYGSCEYTKIIAPELKQVDIFCDDTDACYGLEVEATYVDTMNIVCKSSPKDYTNYDNYYYYWDPDTDSGGRRRRMQNGRDSDTTYSPYDWDWYYDTDTDTDWYDYYDWDYKSSYACDQILVDANYSNDFNIFCNGNNSCYYSIFYVTHANMINLTAIGQDSLYLSYLYGSYVSNKVNIKCWSAYNYNKTENDLYGWYNDYDYDYWSWFNSGACDYAYFYIPSGSETVKTDFICQGYGCYNLNLYSENGLSDLNILIDGCKTCSSIDECIGSWSINCKSQWGSWNYDTFTGTGCTYDECNCNTDQISYQDSAECALHANVTGGTSEAPTLSPTNSPLHSDSPTASPTFSPTHGPIHSDPPTAPPTAAPTNGPSVTTSPTSVNAIIQTIIVTGAGKGNNEKESEKGDTTMFMIIGVGVLCTVIIVVACVYYRKRKKNNDIVNHMRLGQNGDGVSTNVSTDEGIVGTTSKKKGNKGSKKYSQLQDSLATDHYQL